MSTIHPTELERHECELGESWREYDAQGIYLCRVCTECKEIKLGKYRKVILEGYSQVDVDEIIEPDDYMPSWRCYGGTNTVYTSGN